MADLDLLICHGPLNFFGPNFTNFRGEGRGPQACPLDPLLMNNYKCTIE